MLHLLILLALLFLMKSNSSVLNLTTNVAHKQLLSASAYQVLPNPYPVYNSPIVLDFSPEAPGPPLAQRVVAELLDKAQEDTIRRLVDYGNVPIAAGTQQIKYETEVFVYESTRQAERAMRYRDVMAVIRGFKIKERFDGSRHRLATVLYKDVDGRMVEIGEAGLLRRVMLVDNT